MQGEEKALRWRRRERAASDSKLITPPPNPVLTAVSSVQERFANLWGSAGTEGVSLLRHRCKVRRLYADARQKIAFSPHTSSQLKQIIGRPATYPTCRQQLTDIKLISYLWLRKYSHSSSSDMSDIKDSDVSLCTNKLAWTRIYNFRTIKS